jgi:sugar/nucleoside kinase (ribokinase family)
MDATTLEDEQTTPDLLVIGHATRDLLPDGSWRLGGSVTFAGVTASRLGARPAVVTSGTPEVVEALRGLLAEGCAITCTPADEATSFENTYEGGARRQYLRGRAAPLTLDAIPHHLRGAPIVLLAPLAREVAPELAAAFPGALVAATPQGWLRRWREDGVVYPGAFEAAGDVLPHLDALILSREDLLPPPGSAIAGLSAAEADAQIAAWARIVPIVVVTSGAQGADLYLDGKPPETFPGYPEREVDPTGAGDVFATAFLLRLREKSGDAPNAMDFANRVAALSIEGEGVHGIPTRAALLARYPELR